MPPPKDTPLAADDVKLQADLLQLGRVLSERCDRRVRLHGDRQADPADVEAAEVKLLHAIRAVPARRLFGIHANFASPHDAIRVRAVGLIGWLMISEACPGTYIEQAAGAIADPNKPPCEQVLLMRDAMARMTTDRILILAPENGGKWGGKLLLSPRLFAWLAGGQKSLASFSPARLAAARIRKEGGESERDGSDAAAQTVKIPTVAKLQEEIAKTVIGLDGQVRALSSLMVMHLARARMLRAGKEPGTGNLAILIAGNSGCGKSFMMSEAGRLAGCPYASQSATAWTSEGFVGGKFDDLLKALVAKAGGDLQASRFGIAFADEWDKKAARYGSRGDITTLSIQQEVLVPMQGAEVVISGKKAMESAATLNTNGILFAFAGAFDGLTEIIKKKTGKTNIGFATASGAKTRRQEYVLDAIRDYGYVREWVNRLSTVMFLPDPSLKSLETAAANGILSSFNALLGELDVMLFPHAGAIPRMAEFGLETKTFYRGIRSVWWSIAESAVSAGVTGTQMVTAKDVDAAISRVSSGSVGLPPGEDATITPDGEFDGEPDADAAGG